MKTWYESYFMIEPKNGGVPPKIGPKSWEPENQMGLKGHFSESVQVQGDT